MPTTLPAETRAGRDNEQVHVEAETDGSPTPPSTACCWKTCKKVAKEGAGAAVYPCDKDGCSRLVHEACAAVMLAALKASSGFSKVACGKRCYNALVKEDQKSSNTTKKRALWHNDGPTPDISSLSVLIDWITTGNNYSRYRGGEGQTRDTKTTLAGEIAIKIAEAGIKTTRNAKDVTNKITSLETSFRAAQDWLSNTGQGCDENEASIRSAILSRCSYYYELRAIMHDRPSTRPQLLNTDPDARKGDTEDDDSSSRDEVSKSSADSSHGRTQTTIHASAPSGITHTSSKRPASTPHTITQASSKRSRKADPPPQASFIKLKEAQLTQSRDLQLMKLEVRKRKVELQEQEWCARQQQMGNEARAIDARIGESQAQTLKLRQEAEHRRQQRKIELLRERKKLQDEGVAQEDINLLLPLTTYF